MAPSAASRSTTIRVLTWNVWWRFGDQWRARQDGILETLRTAAPDVVALQESWGHQDVTQAQVFADALEMDSAFASPSLPPPPEPIEHPDQEGVSVGLALVSRWTIIGTRLVEMPSEHRMPKPVAMVAELDHPFGRLPVIVACLEYERHFNDDRRAQVQTLVNVAADPALDGALPVVLAGDLNAAAGSPLLDLLGDVLVDAWTAGGGDPDAVTLPSTHPSAPLEHPELIDERIDHIFFRPGRAGQIVTVDQATIVGGPVNGLHPSDHLAVVCDLSWENGKND